MVIICLNIILVLVLIVALVGILFYNYRKNRQTKEEFHHLEVALFNAAETDTASESNSLVDKIDSIVYDKNFEISKDVIIFGNEPEGNFGKVVLGEII